MTIPFMDLKKQFASLRPEILRAIEGVLDEMAVSGGPFVEAFENEFAQYCGARHAVGVSNGTDALSLAMRALGIGPGDEVIVPANSFIATAWGASHAGACPVFVDCAADDWNLDVSAVESRITSRTKAIVGVHLYGQPFEFDSLAAIARKHGLFLVEDCAQAHGATYRGRRVGSLGDAGCFSFYPSKNLGALGEAGAVLTNEEKYAIRLRSLRNHGSLQRYQHDEIGFNMRMDGIQGAVLSIKLKHLDSWNARRQELATRYRKFVSNPRIKMQGVKENTRSVHHLFVITADDRRALMEHLAKNGVQTGLHYPVPCHLQKAYSFLGHRKGDFPNSEYLSDHCLSLPMYPELSDSEQDRVIMALNDLSF